MKCLSVSLNISDGYSAQPYLLAVDDEMST